MEAKCARTGAIVGRFHLGEWEASETESGDSSVGGPHREALQETPEAT